MAMMVTTYSVDTTCRKLLLVVILFFLTAICRRQASCSLVPAPVKLPAKCPGCSNSQLYALTPDPSLPRDQQPTVIDITAFFDFSADNSISSDQDEERMSTSHLIPAALVALDEINNSSNLLQGYHLQLGIRDSRCDTANAVSELANSIADRLRGTHPQDAAYNLGVIVPGCEEVTLSVTGVLSQSLNLPVISYGTPPVLGNKEDSLSNLFHTSRSILQSMRSCIGVLKFFNWTNNIAFISEDSDFFILTVENVIKTDVSNNMILTDDNNNNIPVSEFAKIDSHQKSGGGTIEEFVQNVRMKSVRVIIGLVSERIAARLLCMFRAGAIPGDGFVYVFVGHFSKNWWKTEVELCSLDDRDIQSAIIVSGGAINPNSDAILQSGRTLKDFQDDYSHRLMHWSNQSMHYYSGLVSDFSVGSVYDAVWALAIAMNESSDLISFAVDRGIDYDSAALASIIESLGNVKISGASGHVYFVNGKRGGPDSIQQIQNGTEVLVAKYSEGHLAMLDNFMWNGTNNVTPSDQVTIIEESVENYWLIIVSIFTFTGIVFAVCMCVFNWYYGRHKILLASSQRLNYIIIVGVIFGYLTVVVLTLLNSSIASRFSDPVFKALCLIRIWMLPLSFTLTYGIMFARAWRIYRIFNDPWSSSRKRSYKDQHLCLIVLVAVGIDLLILLPWTIIDPYRRFISVLDEDFEMFSQCTYSSCSSTYVIPWLLVLSVYKIFFIMLGILMISLVRQGVVRRKIFDDSRALAAAVYVTSIAFVVGLPLTILFLLADQPLYSYLASALWVNISSSGTLICIFIPKFYKIVVKKDSGRLYKTSQKCYYVRTKSETGNITLAGRFESTENTLDNISTNGVNDVTVL